MFTVTLMLCNADDEVLITEPDYGPIRVAQMFGKLVRVPLKERKGVTDESRWYFDPEELERRITEKSKLFMFTNPNNPLGYVYSKRDLDVIARIAKKYDLFVFCNECYERQVLSEEFYRTLVFNSLAAFPGMERTFTVQGPTKGYETEGTMLVGWLFGPAKYMEVLKWLHFPVASKHFTSLGDHMVAAVMTSPFRENYVRQ
jgi:aspartate/methionine/tyrosine aminotransferase